MQSLVLHLPPAWRFRRILQGENHCPICDPDGVVVDNQCQQPVGLPWSLPLQERPLPQRSGTLKYNGEQVHSLCEEHRIRHNRNQRRADNQAPKRPCAPKNLQRRLKPRWPVLHDASPARKASPPDATWMAVTEWTWDVLNDDEALPPWSNEDIQLLLECVVDAPSSPFEML
ncbi:hypothetical protein SPRG_13509 [Saprolegnia parasitica CBS 223.65]|uniref:Uncharacterized protein n=1 Tax=Saprolegnia parasitica (strain CBS 223.65) TaxID=695850 RepID=A0A067BPD8_SAPPC|nr:hypothetical protein SPRG_13509 [Saprolegnia parasitica CBS 223.65]KDO20364.1 hypothetical protein SPRG_13509 [Saprolegnia parasitica CBS 223.65]|eukprot:XP_012208958.1 hypothetical protein SPRG_13509 [Saprolegnia parasitica CBS 223.65]